MLSRKLLGNGVVWPIVAATITVNLLALALPLTSRQIIALGQQESEAAAFFLLLGLIVAAAIVENVFRILRSEIVIAASERYRIKSLYWLVRRAVERKQDDLETSPSAKSLDYQRAIEQLRGRTTGETQIALAELAFVPVILALIFVIFWQAGVVVLALLLGYAAYSYLAARALYRQADRLRPLAERRSDLMFAILARLHLVKALAAEQAAAGIYEDAHRCAAAQNLRMSYSSARLSQSSSEVGTIVAFMLLLAFAAFAAAGELEVASVIGTLILAQRLMDPIQRALVVFVQQKDCGDAHRKLADLAAQPGDRPAADTVSANAELDTAAFSGLVMQNRYGSLSPPLDLEIRRGEIVALSAADTFWTSTALRALAGLVEPVAGTARINGQDSAEIPPAQRRALVGYLSSQVCLFDGTILDNITRFGAVSVDDVLEVARLLGVYKQLSELPKGLDTPVSDGGGDGIAPGLVRQIANLRALAHRPRLILLDNADAGLDRNGYADLVAFCEKVRGAATILLASNDANFTSLADRHISLVDNDWSASFDQALRLTSAYRSLEV